MSRIKLDKSIKKIHFIGIGGVSMSALAEILYMEGFTISGSDTSKSNLVLKLKELGVKIFNNHLYENISDDIDLVVYTAAIKENNPEIIACKDKNIKVIDRAQLLGTIMKSFKYPICVSGTHGKTTTTSMLSEILLNLGVDPTITVGGKLNSIGGNFRMGSYDYFTVESCEYYNSFLKFFPYLGIILNVEEDHTDFFKNLDEIESSFNMFAKNINPNGYLVINKNITNYDKIIKNVKCNIITFGNKDSDFFISNLSYSTNGNPSFDLNYKGSILKNITLNIPGEHNIQNALASLAATHALGFSLEDARLTLNNFNGPNRRFQLKGTFNGVTVIDDYAHHPTEIKKTLAALKNMPHNKIYCVFQPHTFSRTLAFLDDFASSFNDAHTVILLDIYPAREKDTGEIHSKDLLQNILDNGKDAIYFNTFEKAENFLQKKCINNDLLITMGAGNVYLIGDNLLST